MTVRSNEHWLGWKYCRSHDLNIEFMWLKVICVTWLFSLFRMIITPLVKLQMNVNSPICSCTTDLARGEFRVFASIIGRKTLQNCLEIISNAFRRMGILQKLIHMALSNFDISRCLMRKHEKTHASFRFEMSEGEII